MSALIHVTSRPRWLAIHVCSYLIKFHSSLRISGQKSTDYTDTCTYFFGKPGEWFALVFSLVALVGGSVVYFVLMSNFLYYTGVILHGRRFL